MGARNFLVVDERHRKPAEDASSANWFAMYAQGHHGYPHPDIDYGAFIYEGWCQHCGIRNYQKSDFVVRKGFGAPHSAIVQINWCFDAWFLRSDCAIEISASNLRGISFRPVQDAKTGHTLNSHRQLVVQETLSCVKTANLARVTCRKDNEEATFKLSKMNPAETVVAPYCGRIKHHPPTSIGVECDFAPPMDVLQSQEWFGSGGNAFRITLVSKKFVQFFQGKKWRGVEFKPVVIGIESVRE